MGANMRCEKNSLALLSSKRTKAFSKSRADEAFALPLFSDAAPSFAADSSYRSGREQRVEHHVNDVERLKQTMLRHESMFKEQLHELHRLYQVQRLLMEESKRKSSASHPHSDSPSSNSSLIYNPELSKVKEERFWEASDASKQLSFFLGQIDVNKPCEDKHYTDRLVDAMPSQKDTQRRPIIDLERPAEEHVEAEGEDEKPLMRTSLFQQVGNPKFPCANWRDSQCSFLSGRSANITMHEEKSTNTSIEFPNNSKWRSFEDCFTRHKEVPFFLSESSDSKKRLVEEANLPSSQTTSLFGVNLKQAMKSRDVQSPGVQSNLDHSRREVQSAGSDACDRSSGQMSKLPHWLLQGLQTTSATNISPISSLHPRQHQTSPYFLQKEGERSTCFDERVPSFSAQQESSDSWLRSAGGGSSLVLRAPQCKSSSGYFFAATTGNTQGFHNAEASNSANDGSAFMSSPPSIERRLGISSTSATSQASSPFITKQSSTSDTEAVSPSHLKELSLNMKSGGSPMPPPWYPQRAPSAFMPQFSKAGAENSRPSNAFLLNSPSSWASVPTHEQVQEGVFTKNAQHTGEGNMRGPACFSPSVATRPDISSKRLIFGFLPTASDLDLTLGLDLNDNESMERVQRVEDGDSLLNEQTRKHDKVGLRSEPFSNDFDLNEQSGDVMDAESQAIPTGLKHKCEGWGMPSGLKAPYLEEWQTSHNSSSLKRFPEETTTSTTTPRQESVNSFLHARHRDVQDHEQLHDAGINGRSLVGGRSSDCSGLTSCKSRSTPIPTFLKSRGDSALSGEGCQSMVTKHPSQEMLFDEASMVMVGRKQGLFSALLGSLEVCQAEGLPIEKFTSKDDDDGISKGKVEAFEAADSLLLMSFDVPSTVVEDQSTDGDEERALKWLADMIPHEDVYGIDGGIAFLTQRESTLQGSQHHLEGQGAREKTVDAFELAVLSLTPISPTSETICAQPLERCDVAEECLPPSNLRRRSLRRGRVGKDFQKEILPSIASLSRQEITEDLQIIEGLVKSATEAMARCSLSSKEDVSWSLPPLSSAKTPTKAKSLRTCKGGKQSGLLRVCSWGEATRRRRMRRQRRVCMPLGV